MKLGETTRDTAAFLKVPEPLLAEIVRYEHEVSNSYPSRGRSSRIGMAS